MRFEPVKCEAQQANGVVFRARDLLVRQRTQCINALGGHLSEYGYVFPQGITHADTVIAHIDEPNSSVPESARAILMVRVSSFHALEAQIQVLDAEITRRAKSDPVARRLMTIPGVGPVIALTFVATVDIPTRFPKSRLVGAHFGLTPKRYASGETDHSRRVSKCGDAMMRTALFEGAQALLTCTEKWCSLKAWGMAIARRRGTKRAIVAVARKLAVILHRMWLDGTEFRWGTEAPAAM